MIDLASMKAVALRHAGSEVTALPRLHLYAQSQSTTLMALVYDPVVTLVLQGKKRTIIGDRVLEYTAGHCMVVAAEVAAMGQICEASTDEPYLAFNLFIDPAVVSSVLLEMSGMPEPPTEAGFGFSKAGPALLDAWGRLITLLDRPDEIAVMVPLLEHELMFRLLMGPQGALLRQIANADTRLSRIRSAMAWIRKHFADHLSVDAMAAVAGMSVSVFHRRFKAVTGQSPLQYQKHIRLHEARQQMVSGHSEAATVAFAVGYESASQFSREYRRLFGASPRSDAKLLQAISETVP